MPAKRIALSRPEGVGVCFLMGHGAFFIVDLSNFHQRQMPRKSRSKLFTPASVKQPPHPVVSLRIRPNYVPSDYPITGVPGAFNIGYSTPGVTTGNIDPRSSRYDIQASGNVINIEMGRNNFNQVTTPLSNPRIVPQSAFTSEPVWEQRLGGGVTQQTVSQIARNQQLQAQGRPQRSSLMEDRALNDFYGNDLFLQSRIPNINHNMATNTPAGDIMSPVPRVHLRFTPTPITAPRQDNQESGTYNDHAAMENVQSPTGQSNLHDINDVHTPQPATAGYSAIGTHAAHGQTPSPHYDGSWTLDVLPGNQQAPLGLSQLPPAADIPVQTYTGSGPQSTSIHWSRPLGGKISKPHLQRVSVFS